MKMLQKEDIAEYSKIAKAIIMDTPYYSLKAKKEEIKKFSQKEVYQNLKKKLKIYFIAKENNKILSFLSGYFDAGVFWVDWIGTLKESRNKGIAVKLFKNMENFVRTKKAHKIWFDSRTNNKESISLFKKMGYKKIALVKNHWYGHDYYLWQKLIKK